MKVFLLLALLLAFLPRSQTPAVSSDAAPVTVVNFKWFQDRQVIEVAPQGSIPAAAMIPQNKNFEKNRRDNTSPGERDPNLDTIDGRSAALEKSVEEARAPKPVEGFSYRAKVHNASAKAIEVIFWEYQFKSAPDVTTPLRRQFLCGVSIKPEKEKELRAFSLSGPHDVISVDPLGRKSPGEERVVVNRVEFADGSIWQRKDWSIGEIRLSYARAVATPWGAEMCRGL